MHEVIDRGDHSTRLATVLAEAVRIIADDSIMSASGRIDPTRVEGVGRMGSPWLAAAGEE